MENFKSFNFDENFVEATNKFVNEYDFKKGHYVYDNALKVNKEMHKFVEYVKDYGKSDNLLGELVRAFLKVEYRFFNDGDMAGLSYGRETVNSAAFVIGKYTTSEIQEIILELSYPGLSWQDINDEISEIGRNSDEADNLRESFKTGEIYYKEYQQVLKNYKNYELLYQQLLLKLKIYLVEFLTKNQQQLLEIDAFENFNEISKGEYYNKIDMADIFAKTTIEKFEGNIF